MYQLLQGIQVLDLTAIVLGPYATQIIGDFGADVIKIEPPAGDLFRSVRPGRSATMGAGFLNLNRNKKSVVLDLKSDVGKKEFYELVASADVVVHNMRPAAANKLKIDYPTLSKINSDVIYCTAAGYGSDGPNCDEPAYDDIIQASSGIAALNSNDKGEPRFLPTIICDKVGGLHLALAILGGIAYKERTGSGCMIEAPMFESIVSFMMVEQMAGMSFNPPLGGTGYERLLSPHRRPFKTKDGYIAVLPYNGKHWQAFLTFAGREEIANADWVQNSISRSENIGKLYEIVSETMPRHTTSVWLENLRKLDIPCAPVAKIEELFDDAHLRSVKMFEEYEHPSEKSLQTCRTPFRVTGVKSHTDSPAPNLGENSDELLR
ncbi:MAG: CoA transferase [Sneathiella sp.]|uniref:CaiB/BaiF CoA transferase family protein n=1 Tax=Sneathiella sp. TaxID=1964365 RepID=UPI000C5B583F|nr:CoA transferase [Sneathiella sp.]MAZ02565.1 CoA transferase [Sneathiella sp.]